MCYCTTLYLNRKGKKEEERTPGTDVTPRWNRASDPTPPHWKDNQPLSVQREKPLTAAAPLLHHRGAIATQQQQQQQSITTT